MAKRQFKAESKRMLDLMINSIYTHKEIFLRELISNGSDAIDKLYYRSLSGDISGLNRDDFSIRVEPDKDAGVLRIIDNGVGMTKDEMNDNLGTIAHSGSLAFKNAADEKAAAEGEGGKAEAADSGAASEAEADGKGGADDAAKPAAGDSADGAGEETPAGGSDEVGEDIDIIGQFGVGFYSAFMVSDKVTVLSRSYDEDQTWQWESSGADGYTLKEADTAPGEDLGAPLQHGTEIILHLKPDTEDEKYSAYLDEYSLRSLVRRYSDYIRYPITMTVEKQKLKEGSKPDDEHPEYESYTEVDTLNSMVPIWKKKKSEVSDEDYNEFYKGKFSDFTDPLKVIRTSVEGVTTYDALLFIPSQAPYNYYSKDYEKGLQLYSSGVLIMDKCPDLLPDYFSFVRGVVDSQDLSLNISREMLQHDRQLKAIARRLEKKIRSTLLDMQKNDRETYEKFYRAFGIQLKFGIYDQMGVNKEQLQDLIMFWSSTEKKLVTLAEYVQRMKEEQKFIYYATGTSVEAIDKLPQAEQLRDRGYEILYMTDDVDEFAIQMMREFQQKQFKSISAEDLELDSEEEKKEAEKQAEENKDLLEFMKKTLEGKVTDVRLSHRLKTYPVCLTTKGPVSLEMEKVLKQMPENQGIKAERVLEINAGHDILPALQNAYAEDQDKARQYTEILYNQALLIEGLPVDDPVAYGNAVCSLMK